MNTTMYDWPPESMNAFLGSAAGIDLIHDAIDGLERQGFADAEDHVLTLVAELLARESREPGRIAAFKSLRSFQAYVRHAARSRAIDGFRRWLVHRRAIQRLSKETRVGFEESPPAIDLNVDRDLLQTLHLLLFDRPPPHALRDLGLPVTELQLDLLQLRFVKNLTYEEIAVARSMSQSTVRRQIDMTLNALRRRLNE